MRLLKNIICITMMTITALVGSLSLQTALAADSEWYWISSDDKYSKYFSMTRINITARENNIPTCIDDWIKTGYAPGGAAEAIKNMNLPIQDPNEMTYSLAHIQINPQERTLSYLEEIFYNKDGKALYTLKYDNPRIRDINSQSFDEKFYAMIVDRVFNKGEGGRLISKERWLNLWSNAAGDSSADTATLRQIGNNVITWVWQENKNDDGVVNSIQFMKKEYNLQNLSARTLKYSYWSADSGWVDNTPSLDKNMHSIIPESTEDLEFQKIKSYAANNPSWAQRYQINAVTQSSATAKTPSSTASTPATNTAPTQTTVTQPSTNLSSAATDVENPIGSVGPIGAPIN